jgi:hypothetical protein
VKPTTFFPSKDRPYVWRKGPSWGEFRGLHRLYSKKVVNFKTPHSTSPSPHYWYPMLKSFAFEIERRFPE